MSDCLEILMNFRLVVLFVTPHPLESLIIPLSHVRFAIVLAMAVILILIMFPLIALLDLPKRWS